MDNQIALQKLNQLLPLAERQAALPAPLTELHRAVLHSFVNRGRPLTEGLRIDYVKEERTLSK